MLLSGGEKTYSIKAVIFNCCATEFLKHAVPVYLVRNTDLFSFRLSNLKMTTTNTTIAVHSERIKIIPIFVRLAKIFFGCAAEFQELVDVCHKMKKVEHCCIRELTFIEHLPNTPGSVLGILVASAH